MELNILNQLITGTVSSLFRTPTHSLPQKAAKSQSAEQFYAVSKKPSTSIHRSVSNLPQNQGLSTFQGSFKSLRSSKDLSIITADMRSIDDFSEIDISREDISKSVNLSVQGSLELSYAEINTSFANEPKKNLSKAHRTSLNMTDTSSRVLLPQQRSNSVQSIENQAVRVDTAKTLDSKTHDSNLIIKQQKASLLDQWLAYEAPKRLNEAMRRLRIRADSIESVKLDRLSLSELSSQKKNVKNELKEYDSSFMTLFKREPEKKEKEVMRPLYIHYKNLKLYISRIEQQARNRDKQIGPQRITQQPHQRSMQAGISEKDPWQKTDYTNAQCKQTFKKKHSIDSTMSTSLYNEDKENHHHIANGKSSTHDDRSYEPDYSKQKTKYHMYMPSSTSQNSTKEQKARKSSKSNKRELLKQRLEELKDSRASLKARLHVFNEEFKRNHNRKIRYSKDLQPVEQDYKKFKELGTEIEQLQMYLEQR